LFRSYQKISHISSNVKPFSPFIPIPAQQKDDYTNRYYNNPSTYPGMSSPDRSLKMYTNPTNPYYDPLWSQGYSDRRAPTNLREDGFIDDVGYGGYGAGYGYGMGPGGGYGPGGWGRGGGYYGYGRGMGPGRRMYAVPVKGGSESKRGLNQNRLMG
jgi:hypothetical protein